MLGGARRAFFVMLAFLAVLWALQVVNWSMHYSLDNRYSIVPHDVMRLPEIVTAPFLHFSWAHIEGNSGPLFVFGFLAAFRSIRKFLGVTVVVVITSGLAVWFFQSGKTESVGVSGVIFGYFAYVVLRGIVDRHLIDTLIGVVIALCYAYTLTVAVPGTPGVSWLDHLGGIVGGVISAWIFRTRRAALAGGPSDDRPAGDGPGGGTTTTPAISGAKTDGSRAKLLKELDNLGLTDHQ
jgi:membrane associated rhomboid family serine protease